MAQSLVFLSNLKGDKGDRGPVGAQGIAGTNGVPADAAVADYISTAGSSATQTAADARYTKANETMVPVTRYGAVGDGATDCTSAIQTAITMASGRTAYVPAGTYMVNADLAGHIGLKLSQPGTRLLLDQGAVLKVIPNGSDNYALVQVTAADCIIEGGTFQGDVSTHTSTTGEWGHLIVIDTGADRCKVEKVVARDAWGDGIIIQRGPADVEVRAIADNNRRQGMSITGALRPKVIGGTYKNTGATKATLPTAGIDVEPNPNSGYDVIGAEIIGVSLTGNKGEGLLTIRATGQTTDVNVSNCSASGNGVGGTASGFRSGGSAGTGRTKFISCRASGNTGHGFDLYATGIEAISCTARANTLNGFEVTGANVEITNPNAKENGQHGIHVGATAGASVIVGGSTAANSQTTTNTYSNFSIDAAVNVRLLGHMSYAGGLTNKPKTGYEINTGAGIRVTGCDVAGTFGTSNIINTGGATFMPLPGFTKAAAVAAPTAAGAAYVQATLQSNTDAINAMRVALQQAGIIT